MPHKVRTCWRNTSIRSRLLIIIIPLVLIPLLASNIISNSISRDALRKQVLERNKNIAALIATKLSAMLDERTRLLEGTTTYRKTVSKPALLVTP